MIKEFPSSEQYTICLERDIVEPNYTTYIACDNRSIGKMAGEFIVEQLKARNGKPAT